MKLERIVYCMFYEVKPCENFKCTVSVPGSKSIANRALIISALSGGRNVLNNMLFSDDTVYMMNSLEALSLSISRNPEKRIAAVEGSISDCSGTCFVGNSGTTIRFLASLIAVKGGEVELQCVERMKQRPIGDLADVLRQLGSEIEYLEKEGYPPLKIKSSGLNGGTVRIKGSISSQFISSLLLAAPYAKGDIEIEVEGQLVSRPYIDITINMMRDFGVAVENKNYEYFFVRGGQRYTPREYTIESDCSAASYFFAAAAIANGDVTVENINYNSVQGDIRILDILEKMGAKVEKGKSSVRVIGNKLNGISIDMSDMPDMAQTLAAAALFAEGSTEIKNVHNLRLKETDRLRALRNELVKIGAGVDEKENGLIIHPATEYKSAEIETYDDHRMAMSFAVTGLKIPGIRIKDPNCVSKTFPDFFKEFEKIYKQQ